MRNVFIIISILLLSSCHVANKSESKSDPQVVNNITIYDLSNENTQLMSKSVDSVSFLLLKEEKGNFYQEINKLIERGEYFYIFDVWGINSLLVFDHSGNFIRKIGNKGEGPNEYVRLWDFDVDSDYIYLYDRAKTQILKYDIQGNFLDKSKMPFRADGFKIINNQKYLFSLVKEDNQYQVLLTDYEFNIESSFFLFDNNDYKDDKGTDNVFQEIDGTIFYNKIINDTIYSFSKNGELLGGTLFDFGEKKIPKELRNSYEDLTQSRKKKNFRYFMDTPFRVNNLWIGSVLNGRSKATFLYDLTTNEYCFHNWSPRKTNYTDIYFPLFATKDYVIGWLDMQTYNSLKEKPVLSNSIIEYLEEGGHLLSFYYLNKK